MKSLFPLKYRRLVYLVLIPIAYLFLLYLCLPFFVRTDYAKNWLSSYLANATSREVIIASPIELKVFPSLEVTLRNISLGNPKGLKRKKMFSAKILRVEAPILDNLKGHFHIHKVLLSQGSFQLASTAEGASNLKFSPQKSSSKEKTQKTQFPPIEHILINNFEFIHGDGEKSKSYSLQKLSLSNLFETQDPSLTSTLRISEESLELTGSASPLQIFFDEDGDLKFTFRILREDLTLKSSGTLTSHGHVQSKIDLSGKSLLAIERIFNIDLPPWSDFKLKTDLTFSEENGETLLFKNSSLQVGNNDLSGELDLYLSPLSLKADFKSQSLNLAQLAASEEIADDSQSPKSDPEIPFQAFKTLDAELHLEVQQLKTFLGLDLENADLQANIKNGALHVEKLAARTLGGSFVGKLSLDDGKIQADVDGKQFSVNPIIELSGGKTLIDGKFDLKLNIRSVGARLSEILHALKGSFKVTSQNGTVRSKLLESTSGNLLEIVSPIFKKSDVAHVECLLFEFDILKGIARSRAQVLKIGEAFFFAEGKLDFRDDTLKYNFHVNSKNPSLTSLIPPFRAYGPISNPRFMPSVSGTVASAADTTEGIARAAYGALTSTAKFLAGIESDTLQGVSVCEAAYEVEQSLISSRVGKMIDSEDTPKEVTE